MEAWERVMLITRDDEQDLEVREIGQGDPDALLEE